jgi:hypothetical protein
VNAANTPQLYIAKHKLQAPTLKEKAEWDKWAVVEADLDNNTDTRDNVIVYDDFPAGKIRTIDGYGITSEQKKVNQLNIYSAFPIKEVRSDVMNSSLRSDLKAWLRKYPTPKEQQTHPFEEFERDVSPFEIIKNAMKQTLNTYEYTNYSRKSHSITLHDNSLKLISFINKELVI